jgi:tetratricopeptide (TPR) repeat protein
VAEPADRIKPKAVCIEEAIDLALASKWSEAASINRTIIERFGPDEETYNRLGKAYTELSKIPEAVKAYDGTLKLNPLNPIALKNKAKLKALGDQKAGVPAAQGKVDPTLFVEEMGKTVVTPVQVPANGEATAKVVPGDQVRLVPAGDALNVETVRGVVLGQVEPALGRRLAKFLDGGNRYTGAVASVAGAAIKIIIREVYQDPQFSGKPSFPLKRHRDPEFRPYAKESLLVHDADRATDDEEEAAEPSDELEGMHTVEPGVDDAPEYPDSDEEQRREDSM